LCPFQSHRSGAHGLSQYRRIRDVALIPAVPLSRSSRRTSLRPFTPLGP
jgi:hypothetical protein